jgi:hypothetical protein
MASLGLYLARLLEPIHRFMFDDFSQLGQPIRQLGGILFAFSSLED